MDGKYLVIQTETDVGIIQLWDIATGHKISFNTGVATATAISPDGKILAIATAGTMRLWNLATHRQIGSSFTVSTQTVYSVAAGR